MNGNQCLLLFILNECGKLPGTNDIKFKMIPKMALKADQIDLLIF